MAGVSLVKGLKDTRVIKVAHHTSNWAWVSAYSSYVLLEKQLGKRNLVAFDWITCPETEELQCGDGQDSSTACGAAGPLLSMAGIARFPVWAFPAAVLAIFASIYFLPSPIDPEPFIFEKPPPALVGSLQVNKKLQSGQRIFTGQLKGPESFTVDDEGK